jgi:hypothetical protein
MASTQDHPFGSMAQGLQHPIAFALPHIAQIGVSSPEGPDQRQSVQIGGYLRGDVDQR